MIKKTNLHSVKWLKEDYQKAIVACGLVDDLAEMPDLDPKPQRFTEGDYICRRGDAAECLWIIVTGSVAVKEGNRTLFTPRNPEIVGEQNLLGNGDRRMYDLVANEASVKILAISKEAIENCAEKAILYRNIARIISLKLKRASNKVALLSRQLEDDTHILHAYTNQYALSRHMQAGGSRQSDYKVDRAIILFSDVVDFSRYTLTMAPERAAFIIQRFFDVQSLPITEHGGHIDKFIVTA